MSKTHWKLTINNQEVELTTTCQRGMCNKCQREEEIRLISEKKIWVGDSQSWEIKKFCWFCSLNNLYQLEESDYQVKNKQEIIKELRNELHHSHE